MRDNLVPMGRLRQAMTSARETLRVFRENRREAVRQYVGSHWSEDGAREDVPVQLLGLYASIVGRKLIAKDPRVMMATFSRELKPVVAAMEDWSNKKIKQTYFAKTAQKIVLDAMFSIGMGKVALTSPNEAGIGGYSRKAGEPYFCQVDLDDAVWDVHARCLEECSFVGHRFRAPIDTVKDSKRFSKAVKKLEPSNDDPYNLDGDERISTLGIGAEADTDEFEEYVELWEIYIPRLGVVVTFSDEVEEPLLVQKWIGPECGPYHFLAMGDVPGNSFPKAPVMDLIDLHELVNRLYRKLSRQANRQKTLLGAGMGSDEDARRITAASDGEAVRLDNPDRAREFNMGGVNQQNLGFAMHAKDLFAYQAGNLDMLGGLSPQSQTLGQDRMLEANASSMVNDMQARVVTYTESVLRAMSWYWWNDPFQTMRSVFKVPGPADLAIVTKITPEQRQAGRFEDLDIDIDPYSMQQDTPASRLQALNQLVMQVILPAMPLLEKQGIAFDIGAYLKKVAKYANMPDLEEIVTIQSVEEESKPASDSGSSYTSNTPASTSRTYTRQNMPGRTRQGQDAAVMEMMANAPQGQSAA